MRVILNPMARGGAGRGMRSVIERALASRHRDVDVVETQHAGHGSELARAAVADGVDVIVAAGGDGTIHEVANGILQMTGPGEASDVAFGVIPIGTGNDFAKVVPGCRTREEALRTLGTGKPRAFDVGRTEWAGGSEYFVNAMGTGVDVEVVRQIERLSRGAGALVYMRGLFTALGIYEPIGLRITSTDRGVSELVDTRIMLVAVANGRCVGGSFNICPEARPDDGRLDLCIVDQMPLLEQIALVPRIVMGKHESSGRVRTRLVQSVTFSATDDRGLFFQLDGELREPSDAREVTVTIEPSRLRVIAA